MTENKEQLERCQDCFWYRPNIGDSSQGDCWRFPPQLGYKRRPEVSYNEIFCGEFLNRNSSYVQKFKIKTK